MVAYTEHTEKWVDPAEVRSMFAELYKSDELYVTVDKIVEIDDELGLELVKEETIQSKYGCPPLNPNNDFHNSLKRQFEERGHLSPKQVNCLMNPRY